MVFTIGVAPGRGSVLFGKVRGDSLTNRSGRLLDAQVGKTFVGDLFQDLDPDSMTTVDSEAVFGQGFLGAADGNHQDRQLHLVGQDKSPGLERFHLAGLGAGAFGEKEHRTPLGQRSLASRHHLADTFLVAPFEADIAVEGHIPPDKGQPENFGFGHPLEGEKQAEGHQDIQLRLVVGDHDVGRPAPDLFTAGSGQGPGRHDPQVEAGPEGGKHVQPYQTRVKRRRQQPNRQRQDKKKAEETAMKPRNRMETMRLVII